MKRIIPALVAVLIALLPSHGTSDLELLEGGFRIFDPDDRERFDSALLSLGPLVLGGVRVRAAFDDGPKKICWEMNFMLQGTSRASRSDRSISVSQKDDVLAFFVFYECDADLDEICVAGASEPVAVDGCRGAIKLRVKDEIKGKVQLSCRHGIDKDAPAFALTAQEKTWLGTALPELGERIRVSYTDKNGEEVSGMDLEDKIEDLDIGDFDDVVGTFLEDDGLPDCP